MAIQLSSAHGGASWAAVHGVVKSLTQLSDFTFTFHFHFSLSCIGEGNGNPLQCSCLENPRDGTEPGGLPSLGSHRVGHDWSDLAAAAAYDCPSTIWDFYMCTNLKFVYLLTEQKYFYIQFPSLSSMMLFVITDYLVFCKWWLTLS